MGVGTGMMCSKIQSFEGFAQISDTRLFSDYNTIAAMESQYLDTPNESLMEQHPLMMEASNDAPSLEETEYGNDQPVELGKLFSSLHALIHLDVRGNHERNLVLCLSVWILLVLWILTGWMKVGLRELILWELPAACSLVALPFVLGWKFRGPYLQGLLLVGAILLTVYLPMVADGPPLLEGWILVGAVYAIIWLLKKTLRVWQRDLQDDGRDSLEFWQRIDLRMVRFLRCLGFVIVGVYTVGILEFFFVIRDLYYFKTVWGDVFFELLTSTAFCGAMLYFLALALLVRDERPCRMSTVNASRTAIRRTRQFVLNPDDPLGEPLLLV